MFVLDTFCFEQVKLIYNSVIVLAEKTAFHRQEVCSFANLKQTKKKKW